MRFLRSHSTGAMLLVISLMTGAAALEAGDWHYGASVNCSDCHTQHNSSNATPMRTDNVSTPAVMLLRRGSALELCISCHDGANPAAPDVIAPISYVGESAAGSFPNSGALQTNTAHHINAPAPEVPPGGTTAMVLTCTTCHDPHGNGNYRNLRPDPTQPAVTTPSFLAVQSRLADGSNPEQVYVPANITYKSGVSAWCAKCHGPSGTNDHAIDRTIWGARYASYTTWASLTSPRVPVLNPGDTTVPSTDDQVMCLSCHKAHGSANLRALIYTDGNTIDSTCQGCHNQ